nr:MAG TPA: hypothetical protein [Caudoviricetes sp.]DAH91135.1 MAG TPA: hypothetical protein [Caudoviricetes sp.]DAZ42224.1 MAG TPA: hypothetical protein [Caudoviricetes sp.]DAZ61361.1 MAG TPA: hypothetical protein [Caudoviricetes sp.]
MCYAHYLMYNLAIMYKIMFCTENNFGKNLQ